MTLKAFERVQGFCNVSFYQCFLTFLNGLLMFFPEGRVVLYTVFMMFLPPKNHGQKSGQKPGPQYCQKYGLFSWLFKTLKHFVLVGD